MPSIRTFVAVSLWVVAPALAAEAPAAAPPAAATSPAVTKPAAPAPQPPVTPQAEPAIPGTGPEADYLRAMHGAIHWRWTKFIDGVAKKRPATDALNNRSLDVDLIFTVRWDGTPAQITVAETSGNAEFDAAAIAALKGDGTRYPVPPVETYGDDGIAHLRWIFARDHRLCGLAEVRRFEAPLREALPRLFLQGRTKEALLRAVRYSRRGDSTAMAEFARAYLARPFSDPALDARAGAALVRAGDQKQIERIKPALARPESVALVAPTLAAAKVDVCALVHADLTSNNAGAVASATGVLRAAGAELPATSPCVETMTGLVKEGNPPAVRAQMLETLVIVSPSGIRKVAMDALGDSDARVRAAGVRAFARPGGGRPSLYRLQPLIGDASPDVRAAVAAGLVRACGDVAKDHLAPFFKGREVQPLVAMAPELGKLSSAGSADLLGKMLKRNDPELRVPVLAALAARRDAPARALYQPLAETVKKDPHAAPEARRIVYMSADLAEIQPLAKDPVVGLYVYKALLGARRHAEAADWIVAAFDRAPPETLVEAFGAWLAAAPAAK